MEEIKKQYIVDSKNNKVAVQIDIEIFNKIESILEDQGLLKFIDETDENENMSLAEATKFYSELPKD